MPDTPTLDVIIVNWNTRELLARCLASLEKFPPAVPYTVWVVDNGSQDGSAAFVREQFPAVQLIENAHNAGFARASNQAIRASAADLILLLNSDAEVTAGSLPVMLAWMADRPKVGALGPKLVNPDGTFQASYARFPTIWSELTLLTGLARWTLGPHAPSPRPVAGEGPGLVDWVAGAALLVRRSAIEQVGLLDENYLMYSEETDWCWRLHRAGWEVWYLPPAVVIHVGGASSRQLGTEMQQRLYAAKLRFFRMSYGRGYAGIARFLLVLALLVRSAGWGLLSPVSPKARRRLPRDIAVLRRLMGWGS